MARTLHYGKTQGYAVPVNLSLQSVDSEILTSLDQFLQWLCYNVTDILELPEEVEKHWKKIYGSIRSCTNYFERYLLKKLSQPLVLGLDEVDQVFRHPEIATDFFGMLRAWHESGKNDSPWQNLHLIITHSKEVYIPLDINQSPFNVGLAIELPEFNCTQIRDCVKRHELNLSEEDLESLAQMTGGHPYLLRVALYHLVKGDMILEQLLAQAPTDGGIYGDHLRRHLENLESDPDLRDAFSRVINTNQAIQISATDSFKLKSMGLVKFAPDNQNLVLPLSDLYRDYFRSHL